MSLKLIFQNRNLSFLWAGQIVSQSGDSIYQIGLLWLVLEITGSESTTGLIAMSSYLPAVLFAMIAGVAADRFDRRRIMLISDFSRALIAVTVPMVFLLYGLHELFLGINAFTLAIFATFFNPARDAIVPQIVPKGGLVKANSLIQTSWQFSLLLGPTIAGVLLKFIGNIHLFTAVAFSYLLSFFLVLSINTPSNSQAVKGSKRIHFRDLSEGFRIVTEDKVLLPLILITIADNLFIMGPAIVGTPVLVKQELGLGAGSYAIIQACYAIGMLLGTFFLLSYGSRFSMGKVLLTGMFFDGLTFIPIFWVENLTTLIVIIIVHSIAIPLLTISRTSLIQSAVPREKTGRVFSIVHLSVVGMSAISAGISGILIEIIGVKSLFMWIGIGGALCGLMGMFLAKRLRDYRA